MTAPVIRLAICRTSAGRALAIVAAAWFARRPRARRRKIERVISPGGIEAWLVREPSLPLVAIDFSFSGGSSQVPAAKAGLASMVADLLDEGAGDLDSRAFHEKVENYAISIGFNASRDHISGSLRTLAEHQDIAFDLLKLSLTAPRFDADVVERVRNQKLSESAARDHEPERTRQPALVGNGISRAIPMRRR